MGDVAAALVATVAAVGIHVAALHLPPTQFVLRVEPLPAGSWVRLLAVATTVLVAIEAEKWLRRRARRR